jgi:hypothetical protein
VTSTHEEHVVPEVSRFYGIVITIYHNDHPPPHFHARYAGTKAKFAIDDLRVLEGSVPPRVRSMVLEWAAQHREELRANWDRARAQQPLTRIAPLE